MAFAIASGLKPEAGIFTAIIAGGLISVLGGSLLAYRWTVRGVHRILPGLRHELFAQWLCNQRNRIFY
jgi:hypothetical protein